MTAGLLLSSTREMIRGYTCDPKPAVLAPLSFVLDLALCLLCGGKMCLCLSVCILCVSVGISSHVHEAAKPEINREIRLTLEEALSPSTQQTIHTHIHIQTTTLNLIHHLT